MQNLRNIQAQIQYLTSKKDPTPQETSLLQKLIEHHQNILATGKPVPTIPGQHAQGFVSRFPATACMSMCLFFFSLVLLCSVPGKERERLVWHDRGAIRRSISD